jgi:hypothetical protein
MDYCFYTKVPMNLHVVFNEPILDAIHICITVRAKWTYTIIHNESSYNVYLTEIHNEFSSL